jgi:transposase
MSTSLFYHVFGTKHYKYLKTHYEDGKIVIEMAKKASKQLIIVQARTILKHMDGILAWYDFRITSGPLEGTVIPPESR